MVRRKLRTSASSSTLLHFFGSASSHNQQSDANTPSTTFAVDSTKHSASRPILDGSSRETALLIDDSSGDEEVHKDPAHFLGRPQKKSRQVDPINIECSPISFNFSSHEKAVETTFEPRSKSKLIVLDHDDEDHQATVNWVMGDDIIEPIEGEPEMDLDDEGGGDEYGVTTDDVDLDEAEYSREHINTCINDHQTVASHQNPSVPATTARVNKPNIFSVLMSSHKENAAWKQAELDHARVGTKLDAERVAQKGGLGRRRLTPFYKVMQGMPIAVDAFRYGKIPGVKAYFLTHAHSDHYTALNEKWVNGPIYCSETTGNLIKLMLGVDGKWVHSLPMDTPTLILGTEITVTLIEANHCPGSVLFLFEGCQTVNAGDSTFKSSHVGSPRVFRYLHCGDFRASPQHVLHPAVKGKKLDIIYLDTTYLNPKYCFPPQRQVIDACVALVQSLVHGVVVRGSGSIPLGDTVIKTEPSIDAWARPIPKKEEDASVAPLLSEERLLVMVGTYSIGKERIVKAIAHALSSKVYCDKRKASILRCQDDAELHALLTNDPYEAQVHLVPLGALNTDKIGDYLAQFRGAYTRVVGFRPTGWTYSPPAGTDTLPALAPLITRMQSRTFLPSSLAPMRNSTSKHMLYGVPYSEHSSFLELTCFALSTRWERIIATVNVGTELGRGKMTRWFEKWQSEIKRRKDRGEHGVVGYRSNEYW